MIRIIIRQNTEGPISAGGEHRPGSPIVLPHLGPHECAMPLPRGRFRRVQQSAAETPSPGLGDDRDRVHAGARSACPEEDHRRAQKNAPLFRHEYCRVAAPKQMTVLPGGNAIRIENALLDGHHAVQIR